MYLHQIVIEKYACRQNGNLKYASRPNGNQN